MTNAKRLPALLFMALLVLPALSSCVIVETPGKPLRAEWAGSYASRKREHAATRRALANRIRRRLSSDPVLGPLHLKFFVHDGEVSLCGPFPAPAVRARAFGIVGTIKGVEGVNDACSPQ